MMWRVVRALLECVAALLIGYGVVLVWADVVLGVNGQCAQQVLLRC